MLLGEHPEIVMDKQGVFMDKQGVFGVLEGGVRRAVEARRNGRGEEQEPRRQDEQEQWRQGEQGQNPGQEQRKQGKQACFGEEEQLRETRAKRTDEPEVTGNLAEVRTGRGSSGLVDRCRADETNRKGEGKGNGGKGEHESKGGGVGRKGTQQVENLVMVEI